MSGFFIWLSGADRDILARCTGLGRSERTRFAGIGALVLVPGVLGLFSMSYALSTISRNPYVYLGGGFVWCLIVVLIDRYLVSTLHKSSVRSGQGKLVSILARFVFSIFVGIAVSHPLVMLWFDNSITEVLAEREAAALEAIDAGAAAEARTAGSDAGAATGTRDFTAELAAATERRECLVALQTAERAGQAVRLPCGFSSPQVSCGPRCVALGDEIAKVDADIAVLEAGAAEQAAARQRERARIEADASADADRLERSFSRDYLARVSALGELEARDPHVRTVTMFMIVFFILVDILPVTLKLATPAGEYEEIRDTALVTVQVQNRAQRQILFVTEGDDEVIGIRARHRAVQEEVADLSDLAMSTLATYNQQRIVFDRLATDVARSARDTKGERRSTILGHLHAMRSNFDDAWSAATTRVKAFLETS